MRIKVLVLALILLSGNLIAGGTIDICEYMLLSRWAKWRFEQVGDPTDVRDVAVVATKVVDGEVRYTVRLPNVGSLQFLFVTFSKNQDGELLIHAMRIHDQVLSDFGSAAPLVFNPPLLIGDGDTEVDGAPTVHPVNGSFKIKVKLGPIKKSFTVVVTGSIATSISSVGGSQATLLDAPDDDIPSGELVNLNISPGLTFTVDDDDLDEPEVKTLNTDVVLTLAQGRGVVFVQGDTFSGRLLSKAILKGKTLGEFPENGDLTYFDVFNPGVFTLHGQSDSVTGDGDAVDKDGNPAGNLSLAGVKLDHWTNGRLFLTGQANWQGPDTGAGETVDIKMSGICRYIASREEAIVVLVGVVKFPSLKAPMVIRTVTSVDEFLTDELEFSFRSGRDAVGVMTLPIAPNAPSSIAYSLDGFTDMVLSPHPVARALATEGVLDMGNATFPIYIIERKITPPVPDGKPAKPDIRIYIVRDASTHATLGILRGTTGDDEIVLSLFRAFAFGSAIIPAELEFDVFTQSDFPD